MRTARDTARLAEEVFALPGRIAERLNRRLAIALDEFQAIGAFDGEHVEHALRAAVQQQRQVGYVFAGSEPTLMEQMIGAKRPFYKAGPVMRLERIPADEFARFIERAVRGTGIRPEPGLGEAIVDLAGNLPYDVQRLAHETWDDVTAARRRTADLEDLHATLRRLLAEQDTLFEAVWQRLTLRSARHAARGRRRAGARDARRRNPRRAIGSAARRACRQRWPRSSAQDLIGREPDGRYVVVDSLFREWVARKTF